MAKKNIVRIKRTWDTQIKSCGYLSNDAEVTFVGNNSNGTEVRLTAIVPISFFQYIARDMMKVVNDKRNELYNLKLSITKSINE